MINNCLLEESSRWPVACQWRCIWSEGHGWVRRSLLRVANLQGKVSSSKFYCPSSVLLLSNKDIALLSIFNFLHRKSFQNFQRNAKSFFVEPPFPSCTNLQRLLLPVQQPSEVSTITIKTRSRSITTTIKVTIVQTFDQGPPTMRGWGSKPRQRKHKSTCSVDHWDSGGEYDQ